MGLLIGQCAVCGKRMLIGEGEMPDTKRDPPYYCSRKKCKKQRGK